MAKGRKKIFKPDYNAIAYNACSRNGARISDLAQIFGVHIDTIYKWMRAYPAFREAIVRGRDEYDTEKIERRLVDLALGYEYEDTIAEKDSQGRTRLRKISRQMPPNVTAMIFYLKNRSPERWKDRLSGLIGNVDISINLPQELLPVLDEPVSALPPAEIEPLKLPEEVTEDGEEAESKDV